MSHIEEDLGSGDYYVHNIDNKESQTRWEVPVYKSISK
jgi:hypothetical protein